MATGSVLDTIVYVIPPVQTLHHRESHTSGTLPLRTPIAYGARPGGAAERSCVTNGVPRLTVKNTPIEGAYLTPIGVDTNSVGYWLVLLTTPELPALVLHIRAEDALASIIQHGADVGGVLGGQWQWIMHGSVCKFVPVGADLHAEVAKPRRTRTAVGEITPGACYRNSQGRTFLCLGRLTTLRVREPETNFEVTRTTAYGYYELGVNTALGIEHGDLSAADVLALPMYAALPKLGSSAPAVYERVGALTLDPAEVCALVRAPAAKRALADLDASGSPRKTLAEHAARLFLRPAKAALPTGLFYDEVGNALRAGNDLHALLSLGYSPPRSR